MIDLLENLASRIVGWRAAPKPDALLAASLRVPAVVITGGSSGIGLAMARLFAQRSQAVVLIARDAERLEAARGAFERTPTARIETLALDIGDPDAPDALVDWLEQHGLYCDVLVNNAAIGMAGPFAISDAAKLDTLIATNVAGLARLTHALLPGMLARARGGVLSIASLGGLIPGPHQAAYYASKAFVISLSEAIASETAGRGVRVTVVLPGPVETRFHARMGAEGSLYRHFLPAASPDRVAKLAIRGFRLGRRVVAPGIGPTIAVFMLRILPHAVSVPVTRWLLSTGRTDS
jgi:short-subunit dehydrogenase